MQKYKDQICNWKMCFDVVVKSNERLVDISSRWENLKLFTLHNLFLATTNFVSRLWSLESSFLSFFLRDDLTKEWLNSDKNINTIANYWMKEKNSFSTEIGSNKRDVWLRIIYFSDNPSGFVISFSNFSLI
jgi:hypothetical protein